MQTLRVLVTGASGFVGSRVARRLAEKGMTVTALLRRPGQHVGLDHPQIQQLQGEFQRPADAASACAERDAVVHCAATVGRDLDDARQVNAEGTAVVAAAARAAGCRRFVHISTLAVLAVDRSDAVLDEDSPLKTSGDNYGLTKAEAEQRLREEMERGLPAVILRPGAILGAHPTSTWATKVPQAIRAGKMPLRDDGRDRLPWVHVEDLLDAVELALARPEAVGRTYHLADGHWEWREYVEAVRGWFTDALPAPVIPRSELKQPGQYFTGTYLAERIREELGYQPRRTWAEGMAEGAAGFARETRR